MSHGQLHRASSQSRPEALSGVPPGLAATHPSPSPGNAVPAGGHGCEHQWCVRAEQQGEWQPAERVHIMGTGRAQGIPVAGSWGRAARGRQDDGSSCPAAPSPAGPRSQAEGPQGCKRGGREGLTLPPPPPAKRAGKETTRCSETNFTAYLLSNVLGPPQKPSLRGALPTRWKTRGVF